MLEHSLVKLADILENRQIPREWGLAHVEDDTALRIIPFGAVDTDGGVDYPNWKEHHLRNEE